MRPASLSLPLLGTSRRSQALAGGSDGSASRAPGPLKTLLAGAASLPAARGRDGVRGVQPIDLLPTGTSDGTEAISIYPSGSREASEALWSGGGDGVESGGTGEK